MSDSNYIPVLFSGFVTIGSIFILPFYFILKLENYKKNKGVLYLVSLILTLASNFVISPILMTVNHFSIALIFNPSIETLTNIVFFELSIFSLASSFLLLKMQYSKILNSQKPQI